MAALSQFSAILYEIKVEKYNFCLISNWQSKV